MRDLAYRILNVFTTRGDRFSGNPLCVFEDGRGLDDATMQALARQLNLSETTFLLPPDTPAATARVRIFTPSFEMPFAGHPTLGTAHVARALHGAGDRVALSMKAGLVEVTAQGDAWTLRTTGGVATRTPEASHETLAAMLGVPREAIAGDPLWVDTGAEQLVVPLASAQAVRAARPSAEKLATHGYSAKRGASMVYVWASAEPEGEPGPAGEAKAKGVLARFFFLANGSVVEDPATGSACANLGGFLLSNGEPAPFAREVDQGQAVARPSRLRLRVDERGAIFVGGDVIEIGKGMMAIASRLTPSG